MQSVTGNQTILWSARLVRFALLGWLSICLSACAARSAADLPDPYAQVPASADAEGPPEVTRRERKAALKSWRAKQPDDLAGPGESVEYDATLVRSVNELLPPADTGPPVELRIPSDPCRQMDGKYESWIDRNQVLVYRSVCGTAAWFDGFFGDRRFDSSTGDTYGRIGLGAYWDEREGWNSKFRFRGRYALPSLRKRGSFFLGRGDEQDFIEGRDGLSASPVPGSALGEQDATFVGFSVGKLNSISRGLSFSVGAKLSAPPEPYAKLKYRRIWELSERELIRLRPTIYWKSDERFGTTVNLDYDRVLTDALLFRWANFGQLSQDEAVEGLNWGTTFYLFQALPNQRSFNYSVFFQGSTAADVTFRNAGFEVRFRHSFLRDWLFVEYISGLSWPREFIDERRKTTFGAGLFLEVYFGPAPDEFMQPRL